MKKMMASFALVGMIIGWTSAGVFAVSETQSNLLKEHCDEVSERLKDVQKNDAKTRVFLGSRYETILNKYMVPLNVRLVENNLSAGGLIDLQNSFAETKSVFNSDYINYQQSLENLVAIDCKSEPDRFYNELSITRKRRMIMEQDVLKMRGFLTRYVQLITELKGRL